MNSFFNWWNTNDSGNQYMTMFGCSMNDFYVVTGIGFLCFCIVVQYLDVAVHNYMVSRRYKSSNVKRYLLYFTGVFVFCLLSGYGYRLMSIWYNPYKFLLLLLLVLNIMTYGFRKYMKRTNILHLIYKAESKLTEKYDKLNVQLEKRVQEGFSSKEATLITYDDLKSLEEGKKYAVNDKVYYIPVDLSGEILHYLTVSKADGWFGSQLHDCYEMCEPYSGELVKNKGRDEVAGIGEKIYYNPNEVHNPGSINGCGINVYFSRKPFKK